MTKNNKIFVLIQGGGLSFKREINEAIAGQIIAFCPSPDIKKFSVEHEKESVAEYMNRHVPQSNFDKILTLAGYLKEKQRKESIHLNEIKILFRESGEPMPSNFSRDIKRVIRNGWLAKDPQKRGNYYITNTGLKLLSSDFSKKSVNKK